MSRGPAAILLGLSLLAPANVQAADECADETCFLIQHTDNQDVLSDFIRLFPESSHLEAATRRLESLGGVVPRGSAFPAPRKVKTLRIGPDGSVVQSMPLHHEPTNN